MIISCRFLSPVLPAKNNGAARLNAFGGSSAGMLRPHSQFDDSTMGSSDGHLEGPDIDEYHLSPVRQPQLPVSSLRSSIS